MAGGSFRQPGRAVGAYVLWPLGTSSSQKNKVAFEIERYLHDLSES